MWQQQDSKYSQFIDFLNFCPDDHDLKALDDFIDLLNIRIPFLQERFQVRFWQIGSNIAGTIEMRGKQSSRGPLAMAQAKDLRRLFKRLGETLFFNPRLYQDPIALEKKVQHC